MHTLATSVRFSWHSCPAPEIQCLFFRILWSQGCPRRTLNRQCSYPCSRLLCLPTDVRCHHVRLFPRCTPTPFIHPTFLAPSRQSLDLLIFPKHMLTPSINRPMLAVGAFAERGRLGPVMVFVFIWSTIVYDPIACWTWNSNGWSFVMGGYDFAGGTPVHISSGTAALAISIYLGKRRGYGTERLAYKPHNTTYVVLGTVFLWFGWFGFNGGSALGANLRAVQACIVTNLAASVGGLTWMLWVSLIDNFTQSSLNI